jgi:hypothetical protein
MAYHYQQFPSTFVFWKKRDWFSVGVRGGHFIAVWQVAHCAKLIVGLSGFVSRTIHYLNNLKSKEHKMSKFVFIYRGGKPGATKEEQDKVMEAWGKWFQDLGEALVDGGNPFGPPKTVTVDGVRNEAAGQPASGFSIVNAPDHEAAAVLAKGCPMLADSPGAQVEVYEAFPM